jgi:hypothetical protein
MPAARNANGADPRVGDVGVGGRLCAVTSGHFNGLQALDGVVDGGVEDEDEVGVGSEEIPPGRAAEAGRDGVGAAEEAGDVLDDRVAGADGIEAASEFAPEARLSASQDACASSSAADVLTGESSAHNVNRLDCPPVDFRDVSVPRDMRPSPSQN